MEAILFLAIRKPEHLPTRQFSTIQNLDLSGILIVNVYAQ